jgi:hypothetical protein
MADYNPSALPQGYTTGPGNINAAGYTQHALLSSIDALPPDVSTKLYRRFGGQGLDILNLLISQGAKRVVNNSNGTFHFEEDRYNQSLPLSGATSGDNISWTFTISSSEGLDTSKPFVVVGDLLTDMANLENKWRVTGVTPGSSSATITAITVDGAAISGAAPTAASTLVIYSSAFGEDTAQPDAKATYWTRYAFPMQRHKTTAKITGDALTDKIYPVMMDDGKTLKGFHSHLFAQHEYRHLLGLVGAMILGKSYNYTLSHGQVDPYNTANAGKIGTAAGMVETFQNRASQQTWATGLTFDNDLYSLVAKMKATWTGNDLIGLFSKELYEAWEQSMLSYTQNVNIASTRQESAKVIFGENTDYETMMSTFAFSTITLNGKNLSAKSFDLSYDPTLFGQGTNNDFTKMGFVMPAEKSADAQGVLRNTVELIYKSMDGEDRFMKVWDDGAASPRRLGPNDNYVVYMLTHFGFEWFKIEQCGFLYQ